MATLFQLPKVVPVVAGESLPGAKAYFYQAGTTTPITTYTTAALSVAHNHPVVADSNGVFAPIFIDPTTQVYRLQLYNSSDVLQYDVDNLETRGTTVELGSSGDTTLSRASAGVLAVEGASVPTISQTQTITAAWTFSAVLTGSGTITGTDEADASGSAFLASALIPTYRWRASTAGTDEKAWQFSAGAAGTLTLQGMSDDYNTLTTVFVVNRTGTVIDDVSLYAGGAISLQVDDSATATHTRFLVYDVDNATLERVTVGAADSGGAGFKVLRIPN